MSLVKTNAAQIGQSLTATNNFTLYQPASPDGTVTKGVKTSILIPILVKAMQELTTEVQSLKAELAALKGN